MAERLQRGEYLGLLFDGPISPDRVVEEGAGCDFFLVSEIFLIIVDFLYFDHELYVVIFCNKVIFTDSKAEP